jgi:CBS domain containing-hemolysin-like protein
MRTLYEGGNKRAGIVLKLTNQQAKLLSAILIGNNVVNLSASSLTTLFAMKLGGAYVAVASGILTLAILLFGEITPKTLATVNNEKISLAYAPIFYVFMKIMTPIVFIVNGMSKILLKIFGVDANKGKDTMTEGELRTIVEVSHEDGVIESDEREMIYNVVDLGDAKAKDVMVPRIHVTFANVASSYDELIEIFKEDKFTRLPIYEETSDNVIGTINMKDLLLCENKEDFSVKSILREAYFTYENKEISELLVEMRKQALNIAIVIDEFGDTIGLITLEDILEEIVGEIHDEYDEVDDELIKRLSDKEYIVDGAVNLKEIDDKLGLELISEDNESVGGYIVEKLDRFPEVGDVISADGEAKLVVESVDKNRTDKVHIYLK